MWYVDRSSNEFSPFGDWQIAVWSIFIFFEKRERKEKIVPVSNSGFELAVLFSDMHWQTHLYNFVTRLRWGVISVGSISSLLIRSIPVHTAFQNV